MQVGGDPEHCLLRLVGRARFAGPPRSPAQVGGFDGWHYSATSNPIEHGRNAHEIATPPVGEKH